MQDQISGWSLWRDAFASVQELNSPSELHGLATAIVCIAQAPTALQWTHILQQLNIHVLTDDALTLLTEEGEDLAAAIHEDDLDIWMMIPDDDHDLSERVTALADWCSGLLLGFGLFAGVVRESEAELLEILQDTAQVQFEPSDDNEEGEESFNELYEFIRLIPISLATGRKKIAVADSVLFAKNTTLPS